MKFFTLTSRAVHPMLVAAVPNVVSTTDAGMKIWFLNAWIQKARKETKLSAKAVTQILNVQACVVTVQPDNVPLTTPSFLLPYFAASRLATHVSQKNGAKKLQS